MLEQEIASAIKFILESSGNPSPYYRNVPQDFLVPAAYFPVPEIDSNGDTLLTYALEYVWFVKFFDKDVQSAFSLGFSALNALQERKNVIPLIDMDGNPTGRGFRMKDPKLKSLENATQGSVANAVQLTLSWRSPRQYNEVRGEKISTFDINLFLKDAFKGALSQINGGIIIG